MAGGTYVLAGGELGLTILDLTTRKDLFVSLVILGITLATNLAAGVARVGPLPFFLGSALGYVPQTAVFALAGSGINLDPFFRIGLAAALFVVSALIGAYLYRHFRHGRSLDREIDIDLGEPYEQAFGRYLYDWLTNLPMIARDTGNMFIDRELKGYEEALAALREALRTQERPEFHVHLGLIHAELGHRDLALQHLLLDLVFLLGQVLRVPVVPEGLDHPGVAQRRQPSDAAQNEAAAQEHRDHP